MPEGEIRYFVVERPWQEVDINLAGHVFLSNLVLCVLRAKEAFGANNDDISIRWSNHPDLHRGWSYLRRILRHALKCPLEHIRAA